VTCTAADQARTRAAALNQGRPIAERAILTD
jgi:hypothetical protein